jgi:hypothetical protein
VPAGEKVGQVGRRDRHPAVTVVHFTFFMSKKPVAIALV